MEPNQNEAKKKNVLIGVIVGLLVIVGITFYYVRSSNNDNTELVVEKAQLDSTFQNLTDTMDVRNSEIAQMTSKNVKLDSALAASQASIENKKKQISGLLGKAKMSKTELAEAKAMIVDYQACIVELQNKVVQLSAQNQQLTQDNQQLGAELTSEKKTSADLNEKNMVLAKRVEAGSLLQLAKVDVVAIKKGMNDKEKTVKNAKAAESLRISFETGMNKVLLKGPLSLYIRVINPRGETISVANQGSGILQLVESNTPVQYSTKADIDWNQTSKKVAVYWKQNINTAGTYKVEIYQSGYLIGKGEVKLN